MLDNIETKIQIAFLNLLDEYEYSEISISQIMATANLNRTIFYTRYDSKDNFLEVFLNDFMVPIIKNLNLSLESPYFGNELNEISASFKYIKEKRNVIKKILAIKNTSFMPYEVMKNSCYKIVYKQINKQAIKKEAEIVELFAHLFAASLMVSITWYLEHTEKVSSYQVARLVTNCLDLGLISIVK